VEGLLDVDEWKKHMEDFVLWSFSQRDRRLRIVLLNNLEYYINAFSIAQIEETIVPELIAGLRDRDENLVTETLKAMHTLFQHLSKFNEGDKVRENLLICLIEVARDYPIEEIRINAFIRLGLLFQLTKCLEKYVVDWFLTGVKSPNECIRLLAVSFVTTAVMTQFDYDIDQKIVSFLLPTLSPLLTDSNSEVREQSYLAICEAAAEVLRRRGHTNLNAIQTRHITLSDIPSLSSSKEKRRNIATKKQTEVTSSSKPCDKTTVQENIKVEVTSSSWNSQFDKLSETESNSLSVATTVPSSVATPAMSTTATTLDTEEKSLKRMGQMQSVPSKMNSDETKIETRETSERDDERDIFVEFGMRPQVKAAPRLHTPPTLAVSASLSEEKTTIPSMSAPTPMKTTSSLSTRLHQVEDVDDFAQRWVDGSQRNNHC
jgi:type II secretory pathway pseudopilin PulG